MGWMSKKSRKIPVTYRPMEHTNGEKDIKREGMQRGVGFGTVGAAGAKRKS